MDEELRSLQLDRIDQDRSKTNEQLKRHTLDAVIESKPVEKALYLLILKRSEHLATMSDTEWDGRVGPVDNKDEQLYFGPDEKGDAVQKISVVQSLPSLIKQDSHNALGKVLPKIQQELSHSSCEFQVTTSHVFQMLITNNLSSVDGTITAAFIQNIDSKDPVVANSWLDALLNIITLMPLKIVQTEVLPVAIHKGQCTQPVISRNAACRILGKISTHPSIKPIEIKKDVLPPVHSLCQDINYNVRATICEQIPLIVQGLGCNMSKVNLLPNLVELSQDDNQNVRSIAVSSVINCLPFLDKETKTSTMIPLVLQFGVICMKSDNMASLLAMAKGYGLLLTHVAGCVAQNEVEVLIGYYIQLAQRGLDLRKYAYNGLDTSQEVICRQHCAMNLPAVTLFIVNNAPAYTDKIYDVFKSLASDSCYMVRQTVAGVLHEVGKTLGKQNVLLKPEFIRLLRDDAEEVLANLVPYLTRTLDLFVVTGLLALDRVTPQSVEVSRGLLKCLVQLKKGYNWRLLATFLRQLEFLPKCFKADQIHNEFTPAVVQCAVKGGTRPVRAQATRTLLVFLRWNTRQVQRTWLKEHLITELAGSKSCYTRHIFILLCKNAFDIFSNKYFKENFYYPLLALTEDQVSTVRYSVVSLLPMLRKMLRLPGDRRLLQALEHVIIYLEKNEKDRDVLTNLIKRSREMMVPVCVGHDDTDSEQRRLIEEEENIYKGRLNFPRVKSDTTARVSPNKNSSIDRARSAYKTVNRSASVTRTGSGKSVSSGVSPAVRSISVPRTTRTSRTINQQMVPPSNREIVSDMTFLNQHFITDAGVPLPIKPTDIPLPADDIATTASALENRLNITDDVKVNMRKLSGSKQFSSEIPTAISVDNRKKRYSSIHSESEISVSCSPRYKRRSLVLGARDTSKIPIILKAGDSFDDKRLNVEHVDEGKSRKFSNLPLPVRRKQM